MAQVYSRSYLQDLPEKIKREKIDQIIKEFRSDIYEYAARGKTSYRFRIVYQAPLLHQADILHHNVFYKEVTSNSNGNIPANISIDELIAGFQRNFPECQISYDESWIDETPTRRYLSKAIIIDWS